MEEKADDGHDIIDLITGGHQADLEGPGDPTNLQPGTGGPSQVSPGDRRPAGRSEGPQHRHQPQAGRHHPPRMEGGHQVQHTAQD